MRQTIKFLALFVAAILILSLGGCKPRSAAGPAPGLAPEEDEAGAMAEQATDGVETPEATVETVVSDEETAEPEATPVVDEGTADEPAVPEPTVVALDPTPTAVPNIEPSPTAMPTEVTPAPTALPVPTSGKHVVQPGENLFRIALNYGLTTAELAAANNITNPALIYVGQELTIPSGGSGTPSTTPSTGGTTHVVQPGENLFRIALKYNVDPNYLASYNGISNPALIYVGQVIYIP